MKRTVREILAECKGGREVMSLRDFTLCIKTINICLKLQKDGFLWYWTLPEVEKTD